MNDFIAQYGPTLGPIFGQFVAMPMAVAYIWKKMKPYLDSHGRRLKRIERHLELPHHEADTRDPDDTLSEEPVTGISGRGD